jgi:hypothetical protein
LHRAMSQPMSSTSNTGGQGQGQEIRRLNSSYGQAARSDRSSYDDDDLVVVNDIM